MNNITPEQEVRALLEYERVSADPLKALGLALTRAIDECHTESHKPVGKRDYDHAFQQIIRALNAVQVWIKQYEYDQQMERDEE